MLRLVLALTLLPMTAAAACRDATFDGAEYTLCEVSLGEDLRLFHSSADGAAYGSFTKLNSALEGAGQSLGFAMNAGMYHRDLSPVGLYVEDGVERSRLVTSDGPGNFGLLPNGVFCIGDSFRIVESRRFRDEAVSCRYATQSGPMLVLQGKLHPKLLPGSDSLYVRNGVGVSADGTRAVFAVSNERVNFHAFARLFRDELGLPDALYFDGNISRLYAPELGRHDAGFPMGPIVGTVIPERLIPMGRIKKGRAVSGWLIVDKPAGVTSTAVVNKVKWALSAQKAGHAGTLDPDATGVLAVALGEATKTIPYITDALKCYRFRVTLGAQTDTDDASGTIIATSDQRPTDAQIEAALAAFRGDIMQVPPQYSAVKVDGDRAYDLAREGEEMDLAARPLWVERLVMLGRPDTDHVDLEMVCGKGGYVRSIARDLGLALGCLGHVQWLRRTWSGPFKAEQGITLATIDAEAKSEALDAHLLPLELGLKDLPEFPATPEGAVRLRNGNPGMVIANAEWGSEGWASLNGQAIAVGHYQAGELHPSRVFNR